MKTQKNDADREAQVRLAFCLQIKHEITPADIAQVMGITEKNYRIRLGRLNLDDKIVSKPSASETALQRLQAELNKLIDGDDLPDKSKAEALMALAKAVKTVGELVAETQTAEGDTVTSVASLHEVRQALIRIDRRIEDLAQRRARDILGRGLDAKSDIGSGL
ncbi:MULTISPECIES: hypothetical protein [Ochrobactrum]|uniref:Terminase small subunit n=1 Tax=Ochrobactrum chromiisoli TaxID=2993941 RepID=A0ABT3QK51_9HYPH|nr:hypothetical protein [Ochrobactrum chromiisoli]MCX2695984.1 hypothetical protein [Ochrobactrum chromiisoli]